MINFKNQNGRSMIEMLGVLAIIGVLSVGGIAGYSKAMMKYRINKTIEQITLIAGNVRTFFAPQNNYQGLILQPEKVIKKAKLAPIEMWSTDESGDFRLESALGSMALSAYPLYDDNRDVDARKSFIIDTYNLPTEACIEIATMDWSSTGNRILSVVINPATVDEADGGFIDKCTTSGQITCNKDLPVSIDKAVQLCDSGDENGVLIKFY